MEPSIRTIPGKKLVGKHFTVTLSNERAPELWRSFMPGLKLVKHVVSSDLFSVQVYTSQPDPAAFGPDTPFEKWAAVEVTEFSEVSSEMDVLTLPEGQYAVFHYKGVPVEASKLIRYIFNTWLPGSSYVLDDRPHFAVMGQKYKNESADSEEEFWIPVKAKGL